MPSDRRRIEANSRAYWGLRGPPLEKANQPLRSGRRNLRGYAVTLQPLFSRSQLHPDAISAWIDAG